MISSHHGQIVTILSLSGLLGLPYRSVYCASKFGLSGFLKSLRAEVKQHDIKVCNFYPEYVQTNISKNAVLANGQPFGKVDEKIANGMTVEYAGEYIMKGIMLEEEEMVVGRLIYRVAPILAAISETASYFISKVNYQLTQ